MEKEEKVIEKIVDFLVVMMAVMMAIIANLKPIQKEILRICLVSIVCALTSVIVTFLATK